MKIIGIALFFSLGVFLRWFRSGKKKIEANKKPLFTCSKNAIWLTGGA